MTTLKPETREKLKTVSTATLCTALYKRGLRNQFIQDVRPLNPQPRQHGGRGLHPSLYSGA
jgi:regulator of RNase E activity RraA